MMLKSKFVQMVMLFVVRPTNCPIFFRKNGLKISKKLGSPENLESARKRFSRYIISENFSKYFLADNFLSFMLEVLFSVTILSTTRYLRAHESLFSKMEKIVCPSEVSISS